MASPPPAARAEISRVRERRLSCPFGSRRHEDGARGPQQHRQLGAPSNFRVVHLIGVGGFGRVYLVQHKPSLRYMSMKVVEKCVYGSRAKHRLMNEQAILLQGSKNAFILELYGAFDAPEAYYFYMKYCPGGDLRKLLATVGVIDEAFAKIYLAEMVVGVHSLHQLGYAHLDLKPENFLIDRTGHLVLADFGLSKEEHDRRKEKHASRRPGSSARDRPTVAGSPDYLSPEAVLGAGSVGMGADWWSIGCMAFEMVVGRPPFAADTLEDTVRNICNWSGVLPDVMERVKHAISPQIRDLIQILLSDQGRRKQLHRHIKCHAFFRGVPWDDLRGLEPPFVPNLEHAEDISYFGCSDDSDGRKGAADQGLHLS